ncbi:hypothetical protein GKZ68_10295 [Hymenobacter sp. BRD128]|uniref:hypothetical protein n=1 Tax=Hymenobacter sp. BRD128 TaxID=2675878 RepID=UPI0015662907|nr:hypothetical protein [Hymenobacter sp. BRD128]QKG56980.1 hypothetical protein GKZ68_10295 [Hymenobacter sp. BRD128]
MLTATITPSTFTATTPTIHRSLPYAEYVAGCDTDSEPFLELTHELGQVFERTYTPHILAQALREVQPHVLLVEVEEGSTLRTDYPTLTEADLIEVEYQALRLTTQVTCLAE